MSTSQRRRWLVLLVVVAGLVPVHLRLLNSAFDDAYIHFRIAEHLLSDGRPYFNSTDAIMASSSSVWTLVLASLFWLAGPVPSVVAVVNAFMTALCVPVYGALIQRNSGTRSGLASDLFAAITIIPVLIASSVGLMETPLATLVVGVGALFCQSRRAAAFAFLAAAPFVRVELTVMVAAIGAAALISRRVRVWPAVMWAAPILVALLIYDLMFFGTVIPSAVRAKAAGYDLTSFDVISRLVPYVADGGTPLWFVYAFPLTLAGIALILILPVGWLARVSFLGGVVIVGAYVFAGAFVFEWYVPLYAVALAWPLAAVILLPQESGREVAVQRATASVLLAILLLPSGMGAARYLQAAVGSPAYAPTFMQGARVREYVLTGRKLFEVFPDEVLLTTEIGGLGRGFAGRIEDGFGLVSPGAVKYHPMRVPEERRSGGTGALPPRFVEEVRPAIVVSYDIFCEAFLRSDIVEQYVRLDLAPFDPTDLALANAAGISPTLWDIRTLHVFVRRDVYPRWLASGKTLDRSAVIHRGGVSQG